MSINVHTIIIIITVAVSLSAFNNRNLLERFMYIPYRVKHNKEGVRLLTHTLIHADYMHLAFNMFALYFLGKYFLSFDCIHWGGLDCGLEETYGKAQGQFHFLAIYVLGALFATLIPYIRHQDNSSYRSLGASGAVSAIIFASIMWNPGMPLRIIFIPIDIPAYIFGPLYLAYEWFADKRGGTGIAHDAHIGGALFGIAYVLIINIDKGKEFLGYFF